MSDDDPTPQRQDDNEETAAQDVYGDYDLVSLDHAAEPVFGAQEGGPHVLRIHGASKCAGETCAFHNPSDHHMRHWFMNWRGDTGVLERLCPHGVGHPDPDAMLYEERIGNEWKGVHGCDGCCRRE